MEDLNPATTDPLFTVDTLEACGGIIPLSDGENESAASRTALPRSGVQSCEAIWQSQAGLDKRSGV